MFFNLYILEAILKTPLSSFPHPLDELTWHKESNGKIFVRNAYRIIQCHHIKQVGENSSILNPNLLWKAIRKMNAMHKIKVFSWGAYWNGLFPISKILKGRI